jgi:hypothetical protein
MPAAHSISHIRTLRACRLDPVASAIEVADRRARGLHLHSLMGCRFTLSSAANLARFVVSPVFGGR